MLVIHEVVPRWHATYDISDLQWDYLITAARVDKLVRDDDERFQREWGTIETLFDELTPGEREMLDEFSLYLYSSIYEAVDEWQPLRGDAFSVYMQLVWTYEHTDEPPSFNALEFLRHLWEAMDDDERDDTCYAGFYADGVHP